MMGAWAMVVESEGSREGRTRVRPRLRSALEQSQNMCSALPLEARYRAADKSCVPEGVAHIFTVDPFF